MNSILDKTEVSHAQVGPRELKDPRSRAYAIQTLYALKRYAESLKCDRELVAAELDEIERYRHWEILGYPSKNAMLAAELTGVGIENVELASRARAEKEQADANKKAGVNLSDNVTKVADGRGNSRSYTLRRLARERPDLLERFERGGLTANAAAIMAGFRRKTWTAPCDVDELAKAIERRYPGWKMVKV